MNFLGHSMISWEIDEKIDKKKETLYGNFAGDFYKGKIERINLPDNLKEGLILHRIIDGISDRKENFLNELLHEKFHHFKGIVSDMFIDHFLSKNFYRVFNENINFLEMAFRGISHRIRNGEILREAVTELKKNYDVFEEKSLSEFNYTKNKSIEKFLEINKIGGVEKWEKFY